tara:strand:- start:232 stop:453 length:222 start_codon:yes stop_codon:yes gene_type:complete
MSNLWMDFVPEKWFEFKHTIHSFPFCHECDLYGEKQWANTKDYPAVLIDAPWPAFRHKPRWIYICIDCWGEEE